MYLADHPSRGSRARPDLRQRHDGVRGRAMGPAVDHHRRQPRAARSGPPATLDRHLPLVRTAGRIARSRRRIRLQAEAEQEGRRGRRNRATHHAQVHRQQRAAGRGRAGRPPGGQERRHACDRSVLRRSNDPHAGRLGSRRRRGFRHRRDRRAARVVRRPHAGGAAQEPDLAVGRRQGNPPKTGPPTGENAVAFCRSVGGVAGCQLSVVGGWPT